jgi:predicted ArsR family transcriptional regulator
MALGMKRTAPKRRTRNYQSANRPSTLAKQARIRELLSDSHDGFTVAEIGRALGMSRQLALYHLKKMVATYQLKMELEPSIMNGGVQFRVWDATQLAARYARTLIQMTPRRMAA